MHLRCGTVVLILVFLVVFYAHSDCVLRAAQIPFVMLDLQYSRQAYKGVCFDALLANQNILYGFGRKHPPMALEPTATWSTANEYRLYTAH